MKKIYIFNNQYTTGYKDGYKKVEVEAETILEAKKKNQGYGI